ncbi:hypothetical protein HZS_1001 [Henneguya salminicola]|nr:hypothetical protein HZS_1001 [Henneguya salminicola]
MPEKKVVFGRLHDGLHTDHLSFEQVFSFEQRPINSSFFDRKGWGKVKRVRSPSSKTRTDLL